MKTNIQSSAAATAAAAAIFTQCETKLKEILETQINGNWCNESQKQKLK